MAPSRPSIATSTRQMWDSAQSPPCSRSRRREAMTTESPQCHRRSGQSAPRQDRIVRTAPRIRPVQPLVQARPAQVCRSIRLCRRLPTPNGRAVSGRASSAAAGTGKRTSVIRCREAGVRSMLRRPVPAYHGISRRDRSSPDRRATGAIGRARLAAAELDLCGPRGRRETPDGNRAGAGAQLSVASRQSAVGRH